MQLTRVAVVAALAGAATSLLAVVAFTALIDQGSASGADTTPAIVVHPHDASATNRPLSTATAGLAPGDTRESVVHLETNDHTGLAGIALTTTAKPDSAITTDTVEGLQMLIERCSVAWTHVPDTTPSHYACEGETRTVLAETPVVVTNRILTHVDLSAGADNFLRVTLSLPHRAGDHLGAEKTVIDWAFAATRGKAQE